MIYPSGDSITVGDDRGGYRELLADMLAPVISGVRFVGDAGVDEMRHGGHSSYSTWDIERNLDGLNFETFAEYGEDGRDPRGGHWLVGLEEEESYEVPHRGTYTYGPRPPLHPDVVLLLVGTNDLFRLDLDLVNGVDGRPLSDSHYASLLDRYFDLLPDAAIFVGQITPYNNAIDSSENNRIRRFNEMIGDRVRHHQATGKAVYLVDMNTHYQGGFIDQLHPDPAGYQWLAMQWSAAISAEISQAAEITIN